jgi:D-alanyl-D-alanine dipeptidase
MRRARAATLAIVLALLVGACAITRPPREKGPFRPSELVELVALDPTLRLDVRYATGRNFTRRPVYTQARAFLQRPAAEALVRAHRALAAQGFGILVFDGYRPWRVTRLFWDVTPRALRRAGFVADPRKGSRHNRGCAADVSLFERASGAEVEMPSGYDEMSERAAADFRGGSPPARQRRDLLRAAMEAEGFRVLTEEWWHFDYRDWKLYPILDVPFEELAGARP